VDTFFIEGEMDTSGEGFGEGFDKGEADMFVEGDMFFVEGEMRDVRFLEKEDMGWFFIEWGPFSVIVEEVGDWFLLDEEMDQLLVGGETG
jgi:hypothetical protein